ncbi:oxidoreductase [Halocatena halophila]|uniref:oxidoreductase n=1 Tax=Halocatena halophila TaxID=2814576 RepID=UPI002ED30C6A
MFSASPEGWSGTDIPDQSDRTFVVTGANSGIGFEITKALARAGGDVVMACRSLDRGTTARDEITRSVPDASLTVCELDLADSSSIESFANSFLSAFDRLDVLINNAGVMWTPYSTTADGFERQFGVNHLGHFALSGLLLDRLRESDGESRIVTQSSIAHAQGRIDFTGRDWPAAYNRQAAYARSKLANLLFTYELDRRLRAVGSSTIGVASHPGLTESGLITGDTETETPWLRAAIGAPIVGLFAQPASDGALPALYAATASSVDGGQYIGPDGFKALWGNPTHVVSSERSYDPELARQLWTHSEAQTGVSFGLET